MTPDLTQALTEVLHPSYHAQLEEVSRRLASAGIPFLLVGGVAVGAYGEPRGTKDIDLLLPLEVWTRPGSALLVPPLDVTDLSKIELIVIPEGLEQLEPIAERTALEWSGIRIVAPEVLAVMKLKADRFQDRADVAALLDAGLALKSVHAVLEQLPPEIASELNRRLETIAEEHRRLRKLKNRLLR